jgi:hypothetical protein
VQSLYNYNYIYIYINMHNPLNIFLIDKSLSSSHMGMLI